MTTTLDDAPAARAAARTRTARRPLVGWALTDGLTIAWRNLLGQLRRPQIVIFAIVQPVMFVLMFRYVFGGAITAPGVDYVDYLMPGIFVQTVVFGGVASAIGLAEDLKAGVIDRFRTLPMARSAVLTGRVLSDVARNLLTVVVMLAVGLAVGFRPDGATAVVAAVGLLLAVGVAFSWYYALVGLLVPNAEAAQAGAFLVVFPLTFASSAFVPTATMPGWLRAFAEHQPVSLSVDAVRALVLGRPAGELVVQVLLWVVGLTVVLSSLAVARYRRAA